MTSRRYTPDWHRDVTLVACRRDAPPAPVASRDAAPAAVSPADAGAPPCPPGDLARCRTLALDAIARRDDGRARMLDLTAPARVVCTHPRYGYAAELTPETRASLAVDLAPEA